MTPVRHILILEDEPDLLRLMTQQVERLGFRVTPFKDGVSAWTSLEDLKQHYDLIILDWMVPGLSGFEITNRARAQGIQTPILMVTAKTDPESVVKGIETGADDYLGKPFELLVFQARVKSLLRRSDWSGDQKIKTQWKIKNLIVNSERHEVFCDSKQIVLTPSEFKLLLAMVESAGKVLTREQLKNKVQGENIVVTHRTVDTHVFGLRKKLGICGDLIETIRSVGYRVYSN